MVISRLLETHAHTAWHIYTSITASLGSLYLSAVSESSLAQRLLVCNPPLGINATILARPNVRWEAGVHGQVFPLQNTAIRAADTSGELEAALHGAKPHGHVATGGPAQDVVEPASTVGPLQAAMHCQALVWKLEHTTSASCMLPLMT